MRTIKFEELPPAQLKAAMKEKSLIYLPIGSMEWHGPHMGMGMDTKNAYEVAQQVAVLTGGVVYPPLYIGTESPRSREMVERIGFDRGAQIIGMDFPENTIKSLYWPPSLFEAVIRQHIEFLYRMGYEMIVLMNGHGADNQIEILSRLSREYTEKTKTQVITIMTLFDDCGEGIGHAGLVETAIMQAICPEGVDLELLPPKSEKLYNTQFAIVDNETFESGPNEDYSVRYDPRDATPETGRQLISFAVNKCIHIVSEAYQNIKSADHFIRQKERKEHV